MVGAVLSLGGLGLLFGVLLGIAARKFAVEKDPKAVQINEVLPGANCGACGFPGCSGLAEAIAKGEAPVNACKVGGASVATKISEIMGVKSEGTEEKMIAHLICRGGRGVAVQRAKYEGLQDCRSAAAFGSGGKACSFGCVGLGNCVRACPFGALSMGPDGLPVVDEKKCTGCGICVKTCPKNVLTLIPEHAKVFVACSSTAPGREVRQVCKVGCIACRICEKTCEFDAIHVVDNLARIDYAKCTNCGRCAEKCPQKIIVNKLAKEKAAVAN
ncbi:MAG: H+/Na+-translocating ferredoxin:NAD+ oxidoreductase subunit [Bacillota bacterium]|jgi:electron transport complex protein RnfB|nr:H+/Na+-translocating ferredoxin:NAD+ oxidoreductase subunit [Bacillota bacterium]MDK2960283.1 H+/Na+-translocating ferredoxin:NAD+ oxidoreductase subunit [Bacillota bacterium]